VKIIIMEDKKDMDPVTIGIIIPAFVKENDSISVSSDIMLVFVMCTETEKFALVSLLIALMSLWIDPTLTNHATSYKCFSIRAGFNFIVIPQDSG